MITKYFCIIRYFAVIINTAVFIFSMVIFSSCVCVCVCGGGGGGVVLPTEGGLTSYTSRKDTHPDFGLLRRVQWRASVIQVTGRPSLSDCLSSGVSGLQLAMSIRCPH